jgi:hypothetical protein
MHISAAGFSVSLDIEKICKWESLNWGWSTAERKTTKRNGGDLKENCLGDRDQEGKDKIGKGCRIYWDHQYIDHRSFDITADAR